MRNKPIKDAQHLSEKAWFEMVLKNREAAQEAGNLAVVARCDELLGRRMNLLPESPERKKVLSEAERKEAQILAWLRFHPRVCAVVDELLAERGNTTPASPPSAQPNAFPSGPSDVGNFGDETFLGGNLDEPCPELVSSRTVPISGIEPPPEPRRSHARSDYD